MCAERWDRTVIVRTEWVRSRLHVAFMLLSTLSYQLLIRSGSQDAAAHTLKKKKVCTIVLGHFAISSSVLL